METAVAEAKTSVAAGPQPSPLPVPEVKKAAGTWVKAPLVGTYYNARSQGGTPFVEIGQHVKKGDVLCIIEAMKVMNEVPAPKDGVITEILVANEEVVDYGKGLVRIK